MDPAFLLESISETPYFTGVRGVPPALRMAYTPGSTPLVAVVGPNASGKSVLRRLAHAICDREGVEFMGVSMEFRTQSGIGRAFVFGSENYESTGRNSASSVVGGLRTCRAREKPHVLFLDEPDVGLSDGYARGVGRSLADFALDPPPHTRAVFVVTHRKALVRELLRVNPHQVVVGEAGDSDLTGWLNRDEDARDPGELLEESHQTFLRVTAVRRALGIS